METRLVLLFILNVGIFASREYKDLESFFFQYLSLKRAQSVLLLLGTLWARSGHALGTLKANDKTDGPMDCLIEVL